jgi:hypothetical protein
MEPRDRCGARGRRTALAALLAALLSAALAAAQAGGAAAAACPASRADTLGLICVPDADWAPRHAIALKAHEENMLQKTTPGGGRYAGAAYFQAGYGAHLARSRALSIARAPAQGP